MEDDFCLDIVQLFWTLWPAIDVRRADRPLLPADRDLPPAEGYGVLKYKRSLPVKGPSGAVFFAVMGAVTGYSWYIFIGDRLERRCAPHFCSL